MIFHAVNTNSSITVRQNEQSGVTPNWPLAGDFGRTSANG
jgi:hypothetical protein